MELRNITSSLCNNPQKGLGARQDGDFDNPHGVICNYLSRHGCKPVKPANKGMRWPRVILCNIRIFAVFVALSLLNPIAFGIFRVGCPVVLPVVRVLDSPVSAILRVIRSMLRTTCTLLRLSASAPLSLALGIGTEQLIVNLWPRHKQRAAGQTKPVR